MAGENRRTDNSLMEYLEQRAPNFDFFNAVRVLEFLTGGNPVGWDSDPSQEAVRFRPSPSMVFPASEIQEITSNNSEYSPQALMTVMFLGLYGRHGTLPWHYSTKIIEEEKNRNPAFRSFFDIFNHRLISLFYRAGVKYHYPLVYRKGGSDYLSKRLLSFAGLSTRGTSGHMAIPDVMLLKYTGLFTQPHSAASLASLLSDFFHLRIKVDQLVGEWLGISADDHNCIGKTGRCNALGVSFTIGRRVLSRQHRFRLVLGPVSFDEYRKFLPGSEKFDGIVSLTRFFCGSSFTFDIKILAEADSVPGMVLGNKRTMLGLSLWLKSKSGYGDFQDPVFGSRHSENLAFMQAAD